MPLQTALKSNIKEEFRVNNLNAYSLIMSCWVEMKDKYVQLFTMPYETNNIMIP